MNLLSGVGLRAAIVLYNTIDNAAIKNSIYESTFLAIMGPMKPVSDVLCTIYASALINHDNKIRIEALIRRIYDEIQRATGVNIPNATALISLVLAICKGKTCELCEKKIIEINNVLNNNVIANAVVTNTNTPEVTDENIAKVNEEISKFLTTLDELIGKANDRQSVMKKLLDKYKEKANTIKGQIEKTLTTNEMISCFNAKMAVHPQSECFVKLNNSLNAIQTELQNDQEFKEFYEKIEKIKKLLSRPQVGGKTRRRRLMRSRRSGRSLRRRRHHQHSSQQSKHKNKRE
jgi:low affinity Fe/Cu permease